jgi:hypothetical protein
MLNPFLSPEHYPIIPEIVTIAGIAMAHKDDEARLERGCSLFDDLYEYFKRKSRRVPG